MEIILLLLLGFVVLIKGADFLIDGASSIAKKFNISDLVIGLTVVAFGSSMPELFVNVTASLNGANSLALGNILGSNTTNILLILGISSIIYPLKVVKGTVWKEIPFSLLAVLMLGILANDVIINKSGLSVLTRSDGLVFLAFFIIFIYYSVTISHKVKGIEDEVKDKVYGLSKSIFFIVIGIAGLALGGKWIVDSSMKIAANLGMSQKLIGLTVVAFGTSLPELATSAMAAYKKNVDIAVGNIVGSNIFNVLLVLGISSIIRPLPITKGINLDIGVAIFATLLLFISMFTGKKHKIDRWEGAVFVTGYVGYMVFLIVQNA
ncbi:MAG: calcium/sodium antiporter [Spirochaetes bacterium]|nr:calcium/sodium antiporter [Spirochaetota bacterium]MCK5268605.1 calcium/sodium antiporter [Spirochaetota bacterium]